MTDYCTEPRHDLIAHIPPKAKRILDVGCGTGSTIKAIQDERPASKLVGLDRIPHSRFEAPWYPYIRADLNNHRTEHWRKLFRKLDEHGPFHCMLFGDVLEHLVDPVSALRQLSKCLRTNGQAIISVPNAGWVGFIENLVAQDFRQDGQGHFDKEHVRFFCRKNIVEVVEEAGLKVKSVEGVKQENCPEWPEGCNGVDTPNMSIKNVDQDQFDELTTYRWIVLADKPR